MDGNYITYEEFKKSPDYNKFLEENPAEGILKVQAFISDQAIPIEGADIYITKNINGQDVLFFKGKTDNSGIIDNIILPAPNGEYNVIEFTAPSYETYELVFNSSKYHTIKQYQIAMFGGVKILQYIKVNLNGNKGGV